MIVVTRAISAARALCAWEAGAIGPDKDCGYEGVIVKAIAEYGDDLYKRAKDAVMKAVEILLKGYESKEIGLTVKQLETLQDINKKISALPDDEDKFFDWAVKEYKDLVPNFNMKNYGL